MQLNLRASNVFQRNADANSFIVVNQGGTSCFAPNQLVITDNGSKPISEVNIGDSVLSFNGSENEFKPVINILKFDNTKPTLRIKLKNGSEIICTDDHKFYWKAEWVCIKHLLSLWDENNTKL